MTQDQPDKRMTYEEQTRRVRKQSRERPRVGHETSREDGSKECGKVNQMERINLRVTGRAEGELEGGNNNPKLDEGLTKH